MRSSWKSILLWLFVINLGIACGAGLYEARVVIPQWAEIPPQSWPNTGLMFWVYVTTIPLTVLTVANLIAAWMDSSPRRSWWLSAAGVILLERVATFVYFIPTMVGLSGAARRYGQGGLSAVVVFQSRPSRSFSHGLAAGAQSIIVAQ